jgi:hypothetical protein
VILVLLGGCAFVVGIFSRRSHRPRREEGRNAGCGTRNVEP